MESPNTWAATAEAIKALPDPIRHYIHQLQTRTDPAGDVRRIAELKDQVEALEVLLARRLSEGARAILEARKEREE
jgi:hypothetical protein